MTVQATTVYWRVFFRVWGLSFCFGNSLDPKFEVCLWGNFKLMGDFKLCCRTIPLCVSHW